MKFVVFSRTHSLLPFAYRLQLEKQDVQPIVSVGAFEKAWAGKMEPSPRDSKGRYLSPDFLDEVIETLKIQNDTPVLIDDWGIEKQLREAGITTLFGVEKFDREPRSLIRFGGWFDGEKLHGHHGLLADRGAWPGGLGSDTDGAMVMVRLDNPDAIRLVDSLANETIDILKSAGFKGLVQIGLNFHTANGEPEVDGIVAGWPFLHTHAFLSELPSFSGLLSGAKADTATLLPKKFVTVLPVSRPPWPNQKARFLTDQPEVGGLTPQQMGRVFWHDVQVDPEAQKLTLAGLDGLVGVVRGAADTSGLALARALEVAIQMQLPEKQFRSDGGRLVQGTLAELEQRFGLIL